MHHKSLFTLLSLAGLCLMLSALLVVSPVSAQEPEGEINAQALLGTAITYQGRIAQNGTPVNGTCASISFSLYDALVGGVQVGSTQTRNNVPVVNGFFTVELDFGNVFTGDERYLQLQVTCGAGSETLSPRQRLTAAPYALGLRPGAAIIGTGTVLNLQGSGNAVTASTSGSNSRAISGSATGAANPAGVYGSSNSTGGWGVFGEASSATGTNSEVRGVTNSTDSNATGAFGLAINAAAAGAGVKGQNNGTGGYGVWGQGGNGATGVLGQTNSTTRHGVWAINSGTGVALRAEGGGDLIQAWSQTPVDLRFRVTNTGGVFADAAYQTPAADFAEMMPAVEGLEATDVLVIGPDGRLERSTAAYQRTVVGVHSTKPAFLGGAGIGADLSGQVPLAVVGIVPVKASAENGAIQPGHMLVASDTPGHAMAAGDDAPQGTVIGKALEGLDNGVGVIQILVILQ